MLAPGKSAVGRCSCGGRERYHDYVRGTFLKSLAAVLVGNGVYFLVLMPVLPPAARHQVARLDFGLVVDFWVCLAVYGVLEWVLRRRKSRSGGRQC